MRFLTLTTLTAVMAVSACSEVDAPKVESSAMPQAGEVLQVAVRQGGTTYYLGRDGDPAGPEALLINAFAQENGMQVKWVVRESTAEVLQTLEEGKAHIAASGLTETKSRSDRFLASGSYLTVTEQVVCPQKLEGFPKKAADLPNAKLKVAAKTSYVETLNALKKDVPALAFEEVADQSTEMLLADATEDRFCVVADSNIADKSRRLFPELRVAFNLPATGKLVWYMPKDAKELSSKVNKWMKSKAGQEAVTAMNQKHYAYVSDFDFVDLRALSKNIEDRLPKYKKYFIEAEKETGMPADLLAALSYQESHWDPDAKSPTGVRGIMMLTQNTAESLGVSDRTDPEEAIIAGAKYLKDRYDRLPDTLPEDDRLYQALASYNIGRAHVLDIRKMAQDMGKNADKWAVVRELLPLKADKNYYPKMKYGYARGHEPVMYVKRIRNYRDVIREAFLS